MLDLVRAARLPAPRTNVRVGRVELAGTRVGSGTLTSTRAPRSSARTHDESRRDHADARERRHAHAALALGAS